MNTLSHMLCDDKIHVYNFENLNKRNVFHKFCSENKTMENCTFKIFAKSFFGGLAFEIET